MPLSFEVDEQFRRLCELLLEDGCELLESVSDGVPQESADDAAQALIIIFSAARQTHRLMQWAIEKEKRRAVGTSDINGLFRNNGVPVKVVAEYMKAVGAQYLVDVLRKPLGKVIDYQKTLEVDPNKAAKDLSVSTMKKNFDKLLLFTETLLDAILAGESQCPKAVKQMFSMLSQIIGRDYPDKVDIAIGGFVFLRFFCPAVVSPEGFELVKTAVQPQVRKNLVLISKTLQNMASGTEFGANEPYMLNANQFLRDVKPNVHLFLNNISTVGADDFSCLDIALPTAVVSDGAASLYYLMHQSAKKIEKLYGEHGKDVAPLAAIFGELGEPTKPAKQTLKAFMVEELRRNESADDDKEKHKEEKHKRGLTMKKAMHAQLVDFMKKKKGDDHEESKSKKEEDKMTLADLDSILDGGRYPPKNRESVHGDDMASGGLGHARLPSKGSSDNLALPPKRALPPRAGTMDNSTPPPLPDAPKPGLPPQPQSPRAQQHSRNPSQVSLSDAAVAQAAQGVLAQQVEQLTNDVADMKAWCTKVASKLSALRSSIGVSAQLATELKALQGDVAVIREVMRGGAASTGASAPSLPSDMELAAQLSTMNERLLQETKARMELQRMVMDLRDEVERLKENL